MQVFAMKLYLIQQICFIFAYCTVSYHHPSTVKNDKLQVLRNTFSPVHSPLKNRTSAFIHPWKCTLHCGNDLKLLIIF